MVALAVHAIEGRAADPLRSEPESASSSPTSAQADGPMSGGTNEAANLVWQTNAAVGQAPDWADLAAIAAVYQQDAAAWASMAEWWQWQEMQAEFGESSDAVHTQLNSDGAEDLETARQHAALMAASYAAALSADAFASQWTEWPATLEALQPGLLFGLEPEQADTALGLDLDARLASDAQLAALAGLGGMESVFSSRPLLSRELSEAEQKFAAEGDATPLLVAPPGLAAKAESPRTSDDTRCQKSANSEDSAEERLWQEQWDPEAKGSRHTARAAPQDSKVDSTTPSANATQTKAAKANGGKPKKWQCQFHIGVEETPQFRVVRRILGPAGRNVKRIVDECPGVRLRLRGRGSKFLEGHQQIESSDPLMLCLTSPNQQLYKASVALVKEQLEKTYEEYREFCERSGKEPPELKVWVHTGARDGSR